MSAAGALRRTALGAVYPALAAYYRSDAGLGVPPAALKVLGIADPSYRADFYTLGKAIDLTAGVDGFVAECGVYKGSTLFGMAHRLRKAGTANRRILGFDSFEGFPEPAVQDALPDGSFHTRTLKGTFSDTSLETLQKRSHALGFERSITLVKGYFENTLGAWSAETFSVVHIDCDLYESYRTCLEFFYPRMARGGYMVFDEYDFSASVYPGAQRAIDEFFAEKLEPLQTFPESRTQRCFVVRA